MKKKISMLLVVACLFTLTSAAMAENKWEPDVEFSTVDTAGKEWNDQAFSEAKLTMLNLWAYWCPPCVGELPDLQKLSEDYAEKGLQLFGVSLEEYEKENVATIEKLGINYPTLRLTESLDEVMNTGYIPTTVFVDCEGHLVGEVYVGSKSYEEWAGLVDKFLEDLAQQAAEKHA